jgi:hypothetical protein
MLRNKEHSRNITCSCMKMEKMGNVETTPGMGEEG